MKLLVDNNISHRVAVIMNKYFTGCAHVSDYKLEQDTDDTLIWNFAKKNDFTILTKDNDFEAMSRLFGCPPKVIQLICGNKTTSAIIKIIEDNYNTIQQFVDDDVENCLMYLQ